MFLLDDLVAAPGKAVFALFHELAKKAQEEFLDDETVKRELQEIYALVEAGRISDTEFESREHRLLERLEQIARAKFQQHWSGDVDAAAPPDIDVTAQAIVDGPALAAPPPVVEGMADVRTPATFDITDVLRVTALQSKPIESISQAMEHAAPAPASAPCAPLPVSVPFAPSPAVVAPVDAAPGPAPAFSAEQPQSGLTLGQVIECTLSGLSLLKVKVSSVTSVIRADHGWHVAVEVVERRSVPDSSDLLGIYELELDQRGNIVRYERTRMRRRCDLGR